jgi:hypothetical protein
MSSRLLVVFLAAVLPSGCTLPELRELGCGDSVLSEGEDCDGRFVMEGGTCGAVGTPNECLYVCSDGVSCPEGWGCGIDERCYQPQPVFDDFTPREPLPGFITAVSDVDGDGIGDPAGSDGVSLAVSFGGMDALSTGFGLGLANQNGEPWFGRFDADLPSDVLIPLERGFLVFTGAPTREYVPKLFSSAREPVRAAAGVVLEADDDILSEVLLLTETEAGSSMRFRDTDCAAVPLPDGQRVSRLASPHLLAGDEITKRIARADVDGDVDGITEFALAFSGAGSLYLYTSTDAEGDGFPAGCLRPTPAPTPVLTLPEGYGMADGNVLFVDVDGDTNLDVLMPVGYQIPEVPGTGRIPVVVAEVWVAHGAGDGTFAPPAPVPELQPFVGADPTGLLAAADLDGNGVIDYVMGSGIFLNLQPDGSGTPPGMPIAGPRDTLWSEAIVVDINDDGFLDVIAASRITRGLDWFLNAGPAGLPGRFNRYVADTVSPPTHLVAGDFDGDFAVDVALVESGVDGGPDELTVVFNVGAGLPGQPQPNGRLGQATWFMDTGVLQDFGTEDGGEIDGIGDLALLSSVDREDAVALMTQDVRLYELLGSTAHTLLSPLYVLDPTDEADAQRVVLGAIAGDFVAGSDSDPASRQRSAAVFSTRAFLGDVIPDEVDTSLALFADAPGDDLARVAVSEAVNEQLSGYLPLCVHWLAGDVEAASPGVDELIAVESSADCNRLGDEQAVSMLVIRLDDPSADPAQAIRRLELPPEYGGVSVARLADLDLDGAPDLVLLGVLRLDLQDALTAPTSDLLILWNDATCATPPYCMERSTKVPAPDLRETQDGSVAWLSPRYVVPLQLDGDEYVELAVLYDRSNTTGMSPRAAVIPFASVEDAQREYRPIALDRDRDGVEDPPMLELGSRNVSRLTAGDVNGDGLDDLLLDEDEITRVYLQMPAEPLGTKLRREEEAAP